MEAELVTALPDGDGWQYEPKWDGFRGILENLNGGLRLWSRTGRPLLRYFPELQPLAERLPPESAVDGEVVVAIGGKLEFEALQSRLHPAESRIRRLAGEIPSRFVAFDVLLLGGEPVHAHPLEARRALLERLPLERSPATRDLARAREWYERLEVAGFDGTIAKRLEMPYRPGERDAVAKIKRHRTAECVVVGCRWSRPGQLATLLLGLYGADGELRYVGSAAASARGRQEDIARLVLPLVEGEPSTEPMGPPSRWGKEGLPWSHVRPELVVEVRYDKWEGHRFRHGTRLERFRPDKRPADCTVDQVDLRPRPGDPTVEALLVAS
jgi:ATP-dependent DNA ligase